VPGIFEIIVPMAVFTTVVLLLAIVVLLARRALVPQEAVEIVVNDQQHLAATTGDKLLWALAVQGVYLPAACGGRGSCGQCRVVVSRGGGALLPTEANHITRRDAAEGVRLACMVTVREDLSVRLPAALLEAKQWRCRVRSNGNLTTYLKELVLELPDELEMTFEAGDYVLLEAPPQQIRFADFAIDDEYRSEWVRHGLLDLVANVAETTTRAYSLANHPLESGVLKLVVRIAIPPPDAPLDTPPGKVSSYVFGLKPGDEVTLSGAFGEFHARDSDREMVFIGGGAGIGPMRAIIFDQLLRKRTDRKMSFWYGARNLQELCYADDFERLAAVHDNFTYRVALSEPDADAGWEGARGLIHTVVFRQYLQDHPSPEEVEYYLCGPPLMSGAVLAMLEDLGVDRDSVFFDNFGS
jgi:Na+-transporting NADH:ubiquinone oxidoreductase subunit F